jgi:hypothetical protein
LTNNFNSGGGNHQTANLTSFVNGFGARFSTPVAINDNNTVIGTSALYIGAGLSANYTNGGNGQTNAAWVANATTGATTQIGLFNQNTGVHVEPSNGSAPGGYVDTPLFLTESGYVAGQTARWNSSNGNSLGLDGWLYDPNKNMTFPVDPAQEASNGYVSTSIEYLSESGVVVGEVKNSSSGAYQAFIYSESGGFALLGNDVTNGLSSSGYNALIEAYYADPSGTIYSTAATSGTTVNAVVSLVPEPTSLSVLALGGVGLLGRRRRLSNRS